MRTQDDRLACACGVGAAKNADNIADGPAIERQALRVVNRRLGQRTRSRYQIAVDDGGGPVEVPGLDERRHVVSPYADDRNLVILGVRLDREDFVIGFVGTVRRIRDHKKRDRTAGARRLRLAVQRGLAHRPRSVEPAVALVLLRFVREDHHGFAGDVEPGVVVVVGGWCRKAVARKHERDTHQIHRIPGAAVRRGDRERVIGFAEHQLHRLGRCMDDDAVALRNLQPGGEFEWLEPVSVRSGRHQARGFELSGNVVAGAFEAGGTVAAPLQVVRRQELDVLEQRLRIDWRRRG